MKRNPLYSPNAKSEQNGYQKLTFHYFNGFGEVDSHGDVIMPGAFKKETKQERFNRIFDVTGAVLVDDIPSNVYIGCDFATGNDKTFFTMFYDCQHCHGSGCDICGGSGKSFHEVHPDDVKRCIKKYDNESAYVFPQFRTKKR